MPDYKRYALYYAPEPGLFADACACWLGWDAGAGRTRAHPDVPGLPRPVSELTARPRRYGVHGTLKPPFRLAGTSTPERLAADIAALAATMTPVTLAGLRLTRIGPFLALCPEGDTAPLEARAAALVTGLDAHRAPLADAERARRHRSRLSARQAALLEAWGYPYVLDEFRFHITLTGPLSEPDLDATEKALSDWIAPILPAPFEIASVCLFGEAADGMFHLVQRYALAG